MDDEQHPTVVAQGTWEQDAEGGLIFGPAGLPPYVQDRLMDATLGEGGYRIRSREVWDQARADYQAGHSARAVCDRYDLSLGTFKHRAAREKWRRCDGVDAELDTLDLDIAEDPASFADLARHARIRLDRAVRAGRSMEAARWDRLLTRFTTQDRQEQHAARVEANRRAEAEIKQVRDAVLDLKADQALAKQEAGTPAPADRAAVAADRALRQIERWQAIQAQIDRAAACLPPEALGPTSTTDAPISDFSDHSDRFFSAPESESPSPP